MNEHIALILAVYLGIINFIGFSIMYVDKKRAERQKWRIRERTLFLFAAIGGSLGTWLGMQCFRHKTKHMKFVIGIPMIFIIQLIGFIMIKSFF